MRQLAPRVLQLIVLILLALLVLAPLLWLVSTSLKGRLKHLQQSAGAAASRTEPWTLTDACFRTVRSRPTC